MRIAKTKDSMMIITREDGTEVKAAPTPAGIIVYDSATGASTLHSGISDAETMDIMREIIESCQKEEMSKKKAAEN